MQFIAALLAILALTTPLAAGIENYFKKLENKKNVQSIRNVDFIYLINLDQRPEKYQHCLNELAPWGIVPYRVSAVNGWQLTLEAIQELGVKYEPWMKKDLWGTYYSIENNGEPMHEVLSVPGRTYFCHCMSRGAIGINLSHLSILQDAYDAGYQTIWVMEDDIQVIKNPHLLSDLIDELDQTVGKKGWDVLFTDPDTKNQKGEYVSCRAFARSPNFDPVRPERFSEYQDVGSFRRIGARYGAYSMIVRRSGMKKILDFMKTYHIFLPFDMEFYLPNNIHFYTVKEDYVSTLINALSDNGGPNYENKK